MLEKLQKQIEDAKKIIEVLPENNKENRAKKEDYLAEEEVKSLGLLTAITKELNLRTNAFNSLVENKNIETLKQELEKCNIMDYWNTYNNSYEKTELDYYLYQLHRYQKKDLVEVNNCIRKIIDIYKNVGVTITPQDLDYHPYVNKYVTMIQNNYSEEELTKVFEQYYWKLPELIKAIELNFKGIFLRNQKRIDKYYESIHKKYLEHHSEGELITRKEKIIKIINQTREKDPYYIFNKFLNKEYNLNDFREEEIKKKKQAYFTNMECTYEFLLEFYQVLYDYKLILKYSYILKDLQELLNKASTLKDVKKQTLKKIQSGEKELLKLVKAKKGLFGKTKYEIDSDKGIIKYKETLNNLIEYHKEFEQTYFEDIIYDRFSLNSTIENALELVSVNYLYFANRIEEHEEGIDLDNINKSFKELKEILNTNNFELLDKITLLDEYQMKQVIVDKYSLDGVKLTIEQLEESNIDKTLSDIKTLVDYENILRSGIKIEDIKLYFDVKDLTSNK